MKLPQTFFMSEPDITTTASVHYKKHFKVDVFDGEDGWIVGRIPELHITTQAKSERDLIKNLGEAMALVKEEMYQNDGLLSEIIVSDKDDKLSDAVIKKTMDDLAPIFKDWDKKLDEYDFRKYMCMQCGFKVEEQKDWVRGKTLCRACFEKID